MNEDKIQDQTETEAVRRARRIQRRPQGQGTLLEEVTIWERRRRRKQTLLTLCATTFLAALASWLAHLTSVEPTPKPAQPVFTTNNPSTNNPAR